jgi:hypothetical protein
MFPAVGQNLKLGRGSLLLAPHDGVNAEAGYIFMGNIPSLEGTWEIETREKFSSTQAASPKIASAVIRQNLTLTAQCDEHTKENLKRFFFATEATATQALSTTNSVAITDVITGRIYDLGKRNITNVVAKKGTTILASGVDYNVYTAAGSISFIDATLLSDGDDLVVEFDNPLLVINQLRFGRVAEQFAKLLYIADDANTSGVSAGDRMVFWKTQVTPDGAYQLISDDYTSFNLKFAVLSDSTHPSDPLGHHERAAA